MKKSLLSLAVLLASASGARAATASVPVALTQQGRLFGNDDQPVNGTLKVTFSIYSQLTGGTPLWTTTRQVSFLNGFYGVTLGADDAQASAPLTSALFQGSEFIGLTIGDGGKEMEPRLPVASVPFALRADLANRIDGGTIANASITGSTIDAKSISVGGNTVIDSSGRYVGQTDQLNAASLGGQPATAYATTQANDAKYVQKAGDQMTGNLSTSGTLAAQGTVSGSQLVATATSGAPLSVASTDLVPNLNAEMLGGKKSADYLTKGEFLGSDFTNLVKNSSFERQSVDSRPTYWLASGGSTSGTRTVVQDGVNGKNALQLSDNDTAAAGFVFMEQTLVPASGIATAKGKTFTLSLASKYLQGATKGEACLVETDGGSQTPAVKDCVTLGNGTDWAFSTVSHTVTSNAAYLKVVLSPTSTNVGGEANVYLFDAVQVTLGATAPAFKADVDPLSVGLGSIIAHTVHLSGADSLDTMKARGFAVCDGTTPAAQGITDAVLAGATPNLNGRFLRGAASTSGALQDDQIQDHGHLHNISVVASGDLRTGGQSNDHVHRGTTDGQSANHVHSGSTGYVSNDHTHYTSGQQYQGGPYTDDGNFSSPAAGDGGNPFTRYFQTSGILQNHTHAFTTGGTSNDHAHSFTSAGASADHTHLLASHSHGINGTVNAVTGTGVRVGAETRPANMSVVWLIRVK